jgi:hypothetical protein
MEVKEITDYLLLMKENADKDTIKQEDLPEFLNKMAEAYENKLIGPDGDDVENGLVKYLFSKLNSKFDLTNNFLQFCLDFYIDSITPNNPSGDNIIKIKESVELILVMSKSLEGFSKETALNRLRMSSMRCGIMLV